MKKNLICCVLSILMLNGLNLSAQYDISLEFQRPSYAKWDQLMEEPGISTNRIFDWKAGAGFAYRIFPHQFRLGYRPGIQLFFGQNNPIRDRSGAQNEYRIMQTYLSFPVQIFPFDLWGDCNCPTFGRQHDFFQKSFYFEFMPSFSLKQLTFKSKNIDSSILDLSFSAGIGAGLNFAINDLLSVSPMISYHFGYPEKWDGLGVLHGETKSFDRTASSVWQLTLKASIYSRNR